MLWRGCDVEMRVLWRGCDVERCDVERVCCGGGMLHRVSWNRDIPRREDVFEVFIMDTCMRMLQTSASPERGGDFNQ